MCIHVGACACAHVLVFRLGLPEVSNGKTATAVTEFRKLLNQVQKISDTVGGDERLEKRALDILMQFTGSASDRAPPHSGHGNTALYCSTCRAQ